ncbi:MAG TPA: ROK family transcriptional regulator [Propionibacteriaceae bacterium]|nr:ROK family transcriptional regulator [Propionibacteriaceae bacterium]HQE32531.1 ROK family transcriptional regulator [Propionibacteriaceae bacterium]
MSRGRRGAETSESASRADIVAALAAAPGSSRLDLAKRIGLGAATVTAQVRRLVELGYVRELPAVAGGTGRPKVPLEVVHDAGAILGVAIAVDHLLLVATGLDGVSVAQSRVPFDPAAPGAMDVIADACTALRQGLEAPLLGVGVALSGVVDEASGLVAVSVVLGWRRVELGPQLAAKLGLPVHVENDLRALATRELYVSARPAPDDFLLFVCGSGVGMALVRNRVVVAGMHGTSTEFGHVSIDPSGPRCRCGNFGCPQAYLGAAELRDVLAGALGWRPDDLAAVVGEPSVRAHLARVGALLGRAVGGAATLLGISDLRLTGETLAVWDALEPTFRVSLEQASTTLLSPPSVVVVPWDEEATAIGASSTAMARILAARLT